MTQDITMSFRVSGINHSRYVMRRNTLKQAYNKFSLAYLNCCHLENMCATSTSVFDLISKNYLISSISPFSSMCLGWRRFMTRSVRQ